MLAKYQMQDRDKIKVTTYNVNGLGSPIKRDKIMTKLRREGTDIAFLQETHLTQLEHKKLERWRFKQFSSAYNHGPKRGVSILISKKLSFECSYQKSDGEGRFVLVRGLMQGILITFLNVYAPPSSDWKFYKQIFELLISEAQGIIICGGDFNVRLHPALDSSKPSFGGKKIIKNIKLMMKELGLLDIWRTMNPTRRDYTFFSHSHNVHSRLDYFFMLKQDFYRVLKCKIGTMDLSDHAPITIDLALGFEKRSTVWRLNLGILNKLRQQIQEDIKEYFNNNDNGEVSPLILWDACKAVLRGKIIGYSSTVNKQRKAKLSQLQSDLKKLENEHKTSMSHNLKIEIDRKKNEINSILTNEIKKR